jgi:sporulation protein YlmC with PRC-barrel domain
MFAVAALALLTSMTVTASEGQRDHDRSRSRGHQKDSFKPELIDANTLIGKEVTNPNETQEKCLGSIREIVLNPQRDKVSYVVVGVDEGFGREESYHAVPWEALEIKKTSRDRDEVEEVTLNISKSSMEKYEGFDRDHWPEEGNQEFVRASGRGSDRNRLNDDDSRSSDRRNDRNQRDAGMHDRQRNTQRSWDDEQAVVIQRDDSLEGEYRKVTEIIGLNAKTVRGEEAGNVESITLDLREGRPVYIEVGFGGFLNLGEEYATLPWSTVDIHEQKEQARLNVRRETLEQIAYVAGEEPNLSRIDRAEQLHERVDEEPYWETLAYVEPTLREQEQTVEGPWKADSSYNRQFKANSTTEIKGKIESVGTFRPDRGAKPGLRLRVRTTDGKIKTIYAGPQENATAQNIYFGPDEQITITGSEAKIQGRSVIIAQKIEGDEQTLTLRDKTGKPQWKQSDRQNRSKQWNSSENNRSEQ